MSIIFENVNYTYMKGTPYEKNALKDINIEFNKGEFIGVIGHTGSGKSTLAQHINGLLKPTSGSVWIDEKNINLKGKEALLARRKIGLVFQYPEHQLFEESVYADIAFGPRNYGASEEEVSRRVIEAMKFVGLDYDTFSKRSPFHLSGGQMRRVAIAGVVALNPDYLVLDEPSAGLDPRGRHLILQQIYKLHKKTGMTVIMISHSMEEIANLTDRMIVMRKGGILLDGTPRQIFINDNDKLQLAGVDVPQVVKIANDLIARGFVFKEIPLTIAELEEAIVSKCKKAKSINREVGLSC